MIAPDLDGINTDGGLIVLSLETLADSRHREHLRHLKEWDAYHSRFIEDRPWQDVHFVMRNMFLATRGRNFAVVAALTSRPERYRTLTLEWLLKHQVQVDVLLMRPDDDYRPDHELKPAILIERFEGGKDHALEQVLFILEDRDKMVETWRNLGFRCWQTQAGGL